MSRTIRAEHKIASSGSVATWAGLRGLGPLDVLLLSVWCGLAAGLLEVGARILRRITDPTNRLYCMSRHFVWLVPLTYLLLFSAMGVFFALATKQWPRRGGWLSPRLICAWAVLGALMVAGRQIYPQAWLVLSLGIGSRVAPLLERHVYGLRRSLFLSFPGLVGLVLILAGFVWGADRLKQWRESGRLLPPTGSPNVLLIVLDTVRADHLSLYGYERPTTPAPERLAKRGIRFEEARATAPWTLPSHASMFTGRWPHELAVNWIAPLGGKYPTLAEYLGSHGYATAGFVANKLYSSYDTGLDRGFTHYEDYVLERLEPVRTARLVDLTLKTVAELGEGLGQRIDAGPFRPLQEFVSGWVLDRGRKNAGAINRAFVDWLSRRPEPGRPFFVFLNYFDAHSTYLPPAGAICRFGSGPRTEADFRVLENWRDIDKLRLYPRHRTLARDGYDNCLAYLDERLGELFEELRDRGVLDRTLLIVTSDHGEGLGEHDLFYHGESLYRSEIRVPLLMVLPSRGQSQAVVRQTVSLRDLPATVVDLVGLEAGSPFPGRSLATLWRVFSPGAAADSGAEVFSELGSSNPSNPNQGRSPASRGSLVSLAAGDFVYIRNEGDGSEELFNERDDPRELSNRAHVDTMQPLVQQFRERLNLIRASPSTAARFHSVRDAAPP